MKLNLGCQVHYFPGWTNVDIIGDDPGIKIDLHAPAEKLPLEDDSVDFIYAGHLIEHYYPDTLPDALAEWRRVLKPGGTLVALTPDCGAIMRDYTAGRISMEATWQQLYGRIYHYDAPSERHHIAFDEDVLRAFFINEFPVLRLFDFNNPPEELAPFMDTHISRGAYQLGIIAIK